MWRQVVRTPLHPPLVYLPFVPCMALTLPHQCRVARWDASEEFKEREGQTREPKSLPHHSLTRALSTVTAAMESRLVGKTLERVIRCADLDFGQHDVVLQILTMWFLLRQGNLPLGNILQCNVLGAKQMIWGNGGHTELIPSPLWSSCVGDNHSSTLLQLLWRRFKVKCHWQMIITLCWSPYNSYKAILQKKNLGH